ncbi:MAG: AtpZ/AtpI family protein [Anaerolineales bacterium]|nr:AtpZ/AtpI family protein [Anaerolineales bacterium]MCB8992121.1 AtpZ/AtpI family protein [Ardenticatenaceae bacterium]
MSQNSQISQTAVLAGLVGQVGCVTGLVAVVIIAVAFGGGRLLDSMLGTGGIITVILMVASFPVTLYAMVRISLNMVQRAQARVDQLNKQNQSEANQEE